ncbi:glycosyltransferase family 1 protein [Dermacoccus sp. 147Ba]|uniref:glycosyltransferase family 4 protein n=1 Tax=Dermacoccus sp. 147Ba TaxID=2510111 RepID=UPI00101E07CC|nr:glycosyltransferase family 4 protein [Dermacoccus sp. 147Ba]RYI22796.1 glycosyltransferase family 1 protein [Dermacoccus sp. 147Ba]
MSFSDRRAGRVERRGRRLVYGTTSGLSLWAFYPGQLKGMRERGWNVMAVSDDDEYLEAVAAREGVGHGSVGMSREISLLRDLTALGQWVVRLGRWRPAVINLGTPKAGLLGGLAAKTTRVPRRIYVVHGLRFEGAVGRQRRLLLAMEKLAIACATHVVVVSPSVGRGLRGAGVKRPLYLIGEGSCNGMDSESARAICDAVDVGASRAAFGIQRDAFVVGFVGRLTHDKGLDQLAGALKTLEGRDVRVQLLAIGDAEAEGAEEILRASGVSATLTGWVDEPMTYMPLMDVLVLPTKREGYPLVVLEANAAGVPVITTRATGAVDAVEDTVDGLLVDYGDADALADRIEQLVNSHALRQRLATAGMHRVRSRFRSDRIWDGLDSIYRGRPSTDVRCLP